MIMPGRGDPSIFFIYSCHLRSSSVCFRELPRRNHILQGFIILYTLSSGYYCLYGTLANFKPAECPFYMKGSSKLALLQRVPCKCYLEGWGLRPIKQSCFLTLYFISVASLALNETLPMNEAVVLWVLLDSILKTLRGKITTCSTGTPFAYFCCQTC